MSSPAVRAVLISSSTGSATEAMRIAAKTAARWVVAVPQKQHMRHIVTARKERQIIVTPRRDGANGFGCAWGIKLQKN
jgi:H+/gluconate symporter-like permease